LNVLEQKGGGSQVVNWAVEESLDLLLMKIHRDYVAESSFAEHLGQQLRDDTSSLPHFTYKPIQNQN
jgi:hypothetical protein